MTKKFALLLSLIVLLPAAAYATTVERLDLDDLVRKAGSVVVGKVGASRTYWSADRKIILTTYTIEVEENLKGRGARSIELTTVGGTIGNVELHVSGMPAFEKDEKAVIFVENTGAFKTVVGLGQGKFTVMNDEVSNNVQGLAFPDGRSARNMKMPLAAFKRQIRSLARQ